MAYFAKFIPYIGAFVALFHWRDHRVLGIAAAVATLLNVTALVFEFRKGDTPQIWIVAWWVSILTIGVLALTKIVFVIF